MSHHDGGAMSHRDLADRAAVVGAALAELGLRPGERVLMLLPDGPGFAEAFLGVMQWDAVPLTVNPALRAGDVTAVAAEAGARVVVAPADRIRALAYLEAGPLGLGDGPQELWAAVLQLS